MNSIRIGEIDSFDSFLVLDDVLRSAFEHAPQVHTERWQSVDISKMPHMQMRELLHFSFSLNMPGEDLQHYRDTIRPNLPWADDHFIYDRISGQPLNPGNTYQQWNPGQVGSAAAENHSTAHLREQGQFDHSYAERYWPRYAGLTPAGVLDGESEFRVLKNGHHGIRFRYGDLDDLVRLLTLEPLTRQAYLPVWFPEDLAASVQHKRVPCSLGYHFIMREGKLDVEYSIRSCDYVRHFRDDVYLTIRLALWVLAQCREGSMDHTWYNVQPGRLLMHIGSFHMFAADHKRLYRAPAIKHLEDGGSGK